MSMVTKYCRLDTEACVRGFAFASSVSIPVSELLSFRFMLLFLDLVDCCSLISLWHACRKVKKLTVFITTVLFRFHAISRWKWFFSVEVTILFKSMVLKYSRIDKEAGVCVWNRKPSSSLCIWPFWSDSCFSRLNLVDSCSQNFWLACTWESEETNSRVAFTRSLAAVMCPV